MFAQRLSAAQAYQQVGLETGVVSASPHKLVVMLFDGALLAIANASKHLAAGQIADKGNAISRAINIIDAGLKACLNLEKGGELAANLYALYDYMIRRLLEGNLKNDAGALDEVATLLRDIRSAWEQIADDPAVRSQKPAVA